MKKQRQAKHVDHYDSVASPNKGKSYQWFAVKVGGRPNNSAWESIASGGWKAVPFRRHARQLPKGFNLKGKISSGGVMLFERSAKVTAAALQEEQRIATAQLSEMQNSIKAEGHSVRITDESFVLYEHYDRVPREGPSVDIAVTIKVRLSTDLQDTAAALKLSNEIYAQRMIDLHADGQIGGLLLPDLQNASGGVYELRNIYLNSGLYRAK